MKEKITLEVELTSQVKRYLQDISRKENRSLEDLVEEILQMTFEQNQRTLQAASFRLPHLSAGQENLNNHWNRDQIYRED